MGKQATSNASQTLDNHAEDKPFGCMAGCQQNSNFWKGLLVSLSILDRPVFPPADFPCAEKVDVVHLS